jgi:hypothetical protein
MHSAESLQEIMELELFLTGGAQSLSDLAHDGPEPEFRRRPMDLEEGEVIGFLRYDLKTREITVLPPNEGSVIGQSEYDFKTGKFRKIQQQYLDLGTPDDPYV